MLEIYYTSAPEGLKSGSSGFCTVAATEGIAKPVLERLEALSGYRHHFAQGQGQANPVSHAHWKLSAGGKEYHVLSRVYDSGVDHTHRTNAFAHHLALESGELAPGGPAAMLTEPGVMTTVWDGRVGALRRTTLPMANGQPGGPCRAWAAAAGDAGYAGLLLEAAGKTPNKPVCILFSPGQDMLPLIDEVLRLVPAAARWQVTFNTYFTSMPTSASCAWRCCVARTPAADAALRAAAAGGIVLNLTEPGKLPPLPVNAYVNAARAGTGMSPALPATIAKPVAKKPPGKLPPKKAAATPAADLELADDLPSFAGEPAEQAGPPSSGEYGLAPEETPLPDLAANRGPPSTGERYRGPSAPLRNVESLLSQAEGHALRARKKRRQQLLIMYVVAGAAVFAGGLLLALALRQNHDVDLESSNARTSTRTATQPPVAPTQPAPDIEPAAVATLPAATEPLHVVETKPAPETKPVVIYVRPSRTVLTKLALEDPHRLGVSVSERSQTIKLTLEDAEDLRQVAALITVFPGDVPEYKYETPTLTGVFSAEANLANKNPSITITWRDSISVSGGGTKVVTLTYERQRNQMVIIWSPNLLVSNSEVALIAYWVIEQTTLLGMDAAGNRAKAQKIAFRPAELPPVILSEETVTLKLPAELPLGSHPVLAGELPKGWTGKFSLGWDVTDPAQRTAENQRWLLALKCPTSSKAVDAFFTLSLKSGFSSVSTDWYKRMAADDADYRAAQGEFQTADNEVKRITDSYAPDIERLEAAKADYEKRALTPKVEGWSEAQAREIVRISALALENKKKAMDLELKRPQSTRTEKEAAVTAFREAMDAYKAIDGVDVTFKLPNELSALTVKLRKKP
jgi:hypothetical protein